MISFVWGFLLPSVGVSLYFYSSPESIKDAPNTNAELKGHTNHGAQFEGENHIVIGDKSNPLQLSALSKDVKDIDVEVATASEPVRTFSWARASNLLWKHFVTSYSDMEVLQWSLWWALALCGSLQVRQRWQKQRASWRAFFVEQLIYAAMGRRAKYEYLLKAAVLRQHKTVNITEVPYLRATVGTYTNGLAKQHKECWQ